MSHMAFTIRDSVIVDGKGFGNSMEKLNQKSFRPMISQRISIVDRMCFSSYAKRLSMLLHESPNNVTPPLHPPPPTPSPSKSSPPPPAYPPPPSSPFPSVYKPPIPS